MRPQFEVAQVLQKHSEWILVNPHFSEHQKRTLAAIRDCRMAALGGHVEACMDCGSIKIQR